MVNNLVFRWPKPLFFMVLGAHGIYTYMDVMIHGCVNKLGQFFHHFFVQVQKIDYRPKLGGGFRVNLFSPRKFGKMNPF